MKLRLIFMSLLAVVLTSCAINHGKRIERKSKRLRSMSDAKLYRKITNNYIDYQTANFKKVSITYEKDGKKEHFKGSVRILKDSIVWLSIYKLGIEGVRVKLTPNSVSLIDRLHREYIETDYSYLNKRFNLKLDFYLVQNILMNQLPEYRIKSEKPFFRNFKGKRGNTHYLFYSKKRKVKKYWKNIQGKDGGTLEILRITPDLMRLESIDIYDTQYFNEKDLQTVNFNLKYNNFRNFGEKYLYPEQIEVTVQRNLIENQIKKYERMGITIDIHNLEINKKDLSFPFKVSRRYKKIDE